LYCYTEDGRLAILDWGQTQVAPESYRLHLCRLVLAMVAEDYPRVADEVRLHSQVGLALFTLFCGQAPTDDKVDATWIPLCTCTYFCSDQNTVQSIDDSRYAPCNQSDI
jgi:hypothetical protein